MTAAWPSSWNLSNPTPAIMYIDLFLMAEFIYQTFEKHTQQINDLLAILQGQQTGAGSLPPADMTGVNQALHNLQAAVSAAQHQ